MDVLNTNIYIVPKQFLLRLLSLNISGRAVHEQEKYYERAQQDFFANEWSNEQFKNIALSNYTDVYDDAQYLSMKDNIDHILKIKLEG